MPWLARLPIELFGSAPSATALFGLRFLALLSMTLTAVEATDTAGRRRAWLLLGLFCGLGLLTKLSDGRSKSS